MKYYIHVLKNYAQFTGRARRSEYWYFFLFNIIIGIITMMIDKITGTNFVIEGLGEAGVLPYGYTYVLYNLFVLIPGLAVAARRLHDTNRSGWMLLLAFIPIIGAIWLLVLFCTDSTHGPNQYGPNPKDIGNTDEIDEVGSYLPA